MRNLALLPDLREMLDAGDYVALRQFCAESHPVMTGEFLSALEPREIWMIIQALPLASRADIFNHLDSDSQADLAAELPFEELAEILGEMPSDDRVDLLKRIPEASRERVLPAMEQAERDDIRRLAAYPEGTAGAIMTSDYVTLNPGHTVAASLNRLRREAPNKEIIYYTYVVDDRGHLIGFVSLKDLILATPETRIAAIMHPEPVCALATDGQESAARLLQKFDLIALPITDGDGTLVGIITHDDALDVITQAQTEDIERFMAIGGDHDPHGYLRTPAMQHFRNRVGWIVGLAAVGLVAGAILHHFEGTMSHLLILAVYMPMLADTGGNTGSQSATVVIRALALGELSPADLLRVLWKELRISLLLAGILAVLAFLKVLWLSHGTVLPDGISLTRVGLTIAVALATQVVSATLIGALLPIGAARFKLDPALIASPALTTVVDITGLLIYFGLARLILGV